MGFYHFLGSTIFSVAFTPLQYPNFITQNEKKSKFPRYLETLRKKKTDHRPKRVITMEPIIVIHGKIDQDAIVTSLWR